MLNIVAWVVFIPAITWWLILHWILLMTYMGPNFRMTKEGAYSIVYSWAVVLIPGIYLFGI
jgi:hypothetical protein